MDSDKIINQGIALLNKGAKAYRQGDYETAASLYQKAADLGNLQALCNLGYIYEYGRTGHKDPEKAFYYYELASIQGNANAAYKLGDTYYYGDFVKQNYDISFACYQRAEALLDYASNDDDIKSDIYYRLALSFYEGNGPEQNFLQAFKYINLAETYSYYDYLQNKLGCEALDHKITRLRQEIKPKLDMLTKVKLL